MAIGNFGFDIPTLDTLYYFMILCKSTIYIVIKSTPYLLTSQRLSFLFVCMFCPSSPLQGMVLDSLSSVNSSGRNEIISLTGQIYSVLHRQVCLEINTKAQRQELNQSLWRNTLDCALLPDCFSFLSYFLFYKFVFIFSFKIFSFWFSCPGVVPDLPLPSKSIVHPLTRNKHS